MTQQWRRGLVPAVFAGGCAGVIGLLVSPARGVTLVEHQLFAVGAASLWFGIVLLFYRFRVIRSAATRRNSVSKGLLLALMGALIALAVYESR